MAMAGPIGTRMRIVKSALPPGPEAPGEMLARRMTAGLQAGQTSTGEGPTGLWMRLPGQKVQIEMGQRANRSVRGAGAADARGDRLVVGAAEGELPVELPEAHRNDDAAIALHQPHPAACMSIRFQVCASAEEDALQTSLDW